MEYKWIKNTADHTDYEAERDMLKRIKHTAEYAKKNDMQHKDALKEPGNAAYCMEKINYTDDCTTQYKLDACMYIYLHNALVPFYERVKGLIKYYIGAHDINESYTATFDGTNNYYEDMKDWCSRHRDFEFKSDKECYEFIHNDAEALFELWKFVAERIAHQDNELGWSGTLDSRVIKNVFNVALDFILMELVAVEAEENE